MAKLPIYEQQTTTQGPRSSGDQFGAMQGQAVSQLGNTMVEIGDRVQSRNEVIDRVRLSNQFDEVAQQELEAWKTNADITDPKALKQYNTLMRSKMDEFLGSHTGRSESRSHLRVQLESQFGNYSRNAITTQIKEQHAMIANFGEDIANKFAMDAMDAPDQIDNLLELVNGEIDKIVPVLSSTDEEKYRDNIKGRIVDTAITGLLNQGKWEVAKAMMGDENYTRYLTTPQAQQAAVNITKAQSKAVAEQERIDRNVSLYTSVLGRDLSAEELYRVKLMPDQDEMTLPDKIAQYELMTGKAITQEQVDKLAGTHISKTGGTDRGTMTERFLNRANELSTSFAMGMTTSEQDKEFLGIVNQLYGVKEVTDPSTGLPRRIQPSMPDHIQQAMKARGFGQETTQPSVTPGEDVEQPVESEKSIWSRASNIAGPVPSIGSTLQKTPFIGQEFGINPQITVDRQYVEATQRQLIRAISQNPRFPVAEMEAIEREVSIGPAVWDNPTAYQQRLVGIDQAMTKRIEDATKSLVSGNISINERRNIMDSLEALSNFRVTLGVPPRVKSAEEAKKLPAGSEFIDPNGVVRRVPEATE